MVYGAVRRTRDSRSRTTRTRSSRRTWRSPSIRDNFPASSPSCSNATVEKMGAREVGDHRVRVANDRVRSVPTPPLSLDNLVHAAGPDVITGGADGADAVAVRTSQAERRARAGARDAAPVSSARRRRGADAPAQRRYSKETLSEESKYPPGEAGDGRARELERHQRRRGRDRSGRTQHVQGRYIIRHYWNGPVACDCTTTGAGRPAIRSGRRRQAAERGWRRRRAEGSVLKRRCGRPCRCSGSRARRRRAARAKTK